MSMDEKRLAEIKKIRNCVPFIDNGAGIPETQAAIDDLIAEVARLTRERDLLARECGAWRQCDNVRGTQVEGECQREAWNRQAETNAAGVKVEG